jgi:hypothetical protein
MKTSQISESLVATSSGRKPVKIQHMEIAFLYSEICENIPRKEIIKTMLRENPNISESQANSRVDALCQWLSLVKLAKKESLALQMLSSLDEAWHAFILNTKLYREFCDKNFGFQVDHDPIEAVNEDVPRKEYALFTLWALKKVYGNKLNPLLLDLAKKVTCCYFSVENENLILGKGCLSSASLLN